MYTVSQTWDDIMRNPEHWFEVKVAINGVEYNQSNIMGLSTSQRMFSGEQPSVGACLSSELTLRMLTPSVTITRMATVEPYVRVTDGEQISEWIPQGIYFIDTRDTSNNDDDLNILTLHCYDAMLKTEAMYPETTHEWPWTDTDVVDEIAAAIGVSVDMRTYDVMTDAYDIPLPASYTMREVLSNIAAMYAGNWVMTYEGKLLLIAINGIPEETSLLVDEIGDVIMFGEDAISLVDAV